MKKIIGTPYRSDWTTYRRQDDYENGETSILFVTGPKDFSPSHDSNRDYDFDCSCCYLGFAHSENYHKRSIEK